MHKVLTIVGTRPEIVKLSRVIAELDRHVEHVLVHTGQNFDYELNEIFFQQPSGASGAKIVTAMPGIDDNASYL